MVMKELMTMALSSLSVIVNVALILIYVASETSSVHGNADLDDNLSISFSGEKVQRNECKCPFSDSALNRYM